MNDQNQPQPGLPQSGQATSKGLATPARGGNPWEGTPDPVVDEQSSNENGQQTSVEGQTTPGVAGQATPGQPATGAVGTPTQVAGAQGTATQSQQGLSAADISQLVAQTVKAVGVPQQQQAAPQQQFSEQDFIRTFNVFQATPEVLASVGLPNTPESVAAFNNISTAIVKQAVTMGAYQMEKLKADLTSQFERQLEQYRPAKEMAQKHIEEGLKAEFLTANPDLKGFEPLLEEIKDRLISQGQQFKSKEELFQTISGHARQIIQKIPGLQGQQAGGEGQQNQPAVTTNGASRMSALSGAGQGGVGSGKTAGGAKRKNTSESLWG